MLYSFDFVKDLLNGLFWFSFNYFSIFLCIYPWGQVLIRHLRVLCRCSVSLRSCLNSIIFQKDAWARSQRQTPELQKWSRTGPRICGTYNTTLKPNEGSLHQMKLFWINQQYQSSVNHDLMPAVSRLNLTMNTRDCITGTSKVPRAYSVNL